MNPYITKLALVFAFAALLAVHAAPQAPAAIPGDDGWTATASTAPGGPSLIDPAGRTKPGYVWFGGVWVTIRSVGGTIPGHQSAPRSSRHAGREPAPVSPSAFAWSDFGLGAGTVVAGALGLGLGAAALRRTVRRAPAF